MDNFLTVGLTNVVISFLKKKYNIKHIALDKERSTTDTEVYVLRKFHLCVPCFIIVCDHSKDGFSIHINPYLTQEVKETSYIYSNSEYENITDYFNDVIMNLENWCIDVINKYENKFYTIAHISNNETIQDELEEYFYDLIKENMNSIDTDETLNKITELFNNKYDKLKIDFYKNDIDKINTESKEYKIIELEVKNTYIDSINGVLHCLELTFNDIHSKNEIDVIINMADKQLHDELYDIYLSNKIVDINKYIDLAVSEGNVLH